MRPETLKTSFNWPNCLSTPWCAKILLKEMKVMGMNWQPLTQLRPRKLLKIQVFLYALGYSRWVTQGTSSGKREMIKLRLNHLKVPLLLWQTRSKSDLTWLKTKTHTVWSYRKAILLLSSLFAATLSQLEFQPHNFAQKIKASRPSCTARKTLRHQLCTSPR